jgi:hypothetical protein
LAEGKLWNASNTVIESAAFCIRSGYNFLLPNSDISLTSKFRLPEKTWHQTFVGASRY